MSCVHASVGARPHQDEESCRAVLLPKVRNPMHPAEYIAKFADGAADKWPDMALSGQAISCGAGRCTRRGTSKFVSGRGLRAQRCPGVAAS